MNLKKKFNKKSFLRAMAKNGYEQVTGWLFIVDHGKIKACAAGQGLINYGIISEEDIRINPMSARSNALIYIKENFPHGLYVDIYRLNDLSGMSCEDIAEELLAENE